MEVPQGLRDVPGQHAPPLLPGSPRRQRPAPGDPESSSIGAVLDGMTEPGLAIARPLRIRIQVVLYRSDARLRRLLPALDHLDTAGMSVELHFLNNSPGDGTEAVIASHAPRLAYTYRDSPRGNIGFGAGHNLLALDADAPVDFILLLNPDTIPFDDLLVRLVDAARDRPRGLLFEAAQFPVEHPTLIQRA